MEPIELTARREALGFTIFALAKHLDIRENSLARWEGGTYQPKDWGWIEEALAALEAYQAQECRRLVAEAVREGQAPPVVQVGTYRVDEDLWAADDEAARARIPALVHRTAAARAASLIRSVDGVAASVVAKAP